MASTGVLISLGILLLMLVLSFLFSGAEIAFLSASQLKIELKLKQGSRAAKILNSFLKRKEEVIIAILIGNNVALVLFTREWDTLFRPVFSGLLGENQDQNLLLYTLIQTFLTTLVVLVFAEFIPKAIFRKKSDSIVFPIAYFLRIVHALLYVVIFVVGNITKLLLRIFIKTTHDQPIVAFGMKDLDIYIQEVIEATETTPLPKLDTDMLSNAMSLKDTKARECMIPRTEIIAISWDSDVQELMNMFIETQLSKIIVYQDSLDNVRGVVHSIGMFKHPKKLDDIIQPVLIVPETMPANVLLAEFTENKKSVAIVVDEFGGTSGMITIEDLVEEVFGEIEDEHDQEETKELEEDMIIEKLQEGSYRLGARLEIDDINESEEIDLLLPDEEYYTTLGGMIMFYAEDIPEEGQSIIIRDYIFTVEKATPNRVILVKVEKA